MVCIPQTALWTGKTLGNWGGSSSFFCWKQPWHTTIPPSYKLVYKPQELYSYKYHKPVREIGVISSPQLNAIRYRGKRGPITIVPFRVVPRGSTWRRCWVCRWVWWCWTPWWTPAAAPPICHKPRSSWTTWRGSRGPWRRSVDETCGLNGKNHGKTHGKMGKPGENHGKMGKPMGKTWEILEHIGTSEGFNGGFNGKYPWENMRKSLRKIFFLRLGFWTLGGKTWEQPSG